MSPVEQITASYRTNQEAARRCVVVALEGAEKVFKLQMEVTQELIAKSHDQAKEMWSSFDPSPTSVDWPAVFGSTFQRGVEMTRTCLQAVTELQKGFAHIVEWQAPALSESMNDAAQGLVNMDWARAVRSSEGAAEMVERKRKRAAA